MLEERNKESCDDDENSDVPDWWENTLGLEKQSELKGKLGGDGVSVVQLLVIKIKIAPITPSESREPNNRGIMQIKRG